MSENGQRIVASPVIFEAVPPKGSSIMSPLGAIAVAPRTEDSIKIPLIGYQASKQNSA